MYFKLLNALQADCLISVLGALFNNISNIDIDSNILVVFWKQEHFQSMLF